MTAFTYKIYLTLLSCLMISQVQAQPQLNLPATTLTILSYVRWNTPNPISLCILNNNQLSNQFIQVNQQLKSAYQIQAVSLSELNQVMCNAVFFSTYTPREEQNIINNLSVHDKFHRTLILSGICLLKIARISLNSSFFPKPIKR